MPCHEDYIWLKQVHVSYLELEDNLATDPAKIELFCWRCMVIGMYKTAAIHAHRDTLDRPSLQAVTYCLRLQQSAWQACFLPMLQLTIQGESHHEQHCLLCLTAFRCCQAMHAGGRPRLPVPVSIMPASCIMCLMCT